MRTTITLDPDVHAALTNVAHRKGRSLKSTVNDAIRIGLASEARAYQRPGPPEWPVFDMGAPLIDLHKASALSAELEDQDLIAKLGRGA